MCARSNYCGGIDREADCPAITEAYCSSFITANMEAYSRTDGGTNPFAYIASYTATVI